MVKVVQEERIRRSWEELISEGLEAREEGDESRWKRGDLANEITVSYGKDSLGKYAYAIGTAKKTLMNYRTVANKFNKKLREKYKKLSFSHFATIASTKKPEAWLEKADNREWSVEKLRKEIKSAYQDIKGLEVEDKPPKVYRCPECNLWRLEGISSYEICKGHYIMNDSGKIIYK